MGSEMWHLILLPAVQFNSFTPVNDCQKATTVPNQKQIFTVAGQIIYLALSTNLLHRGSYLKKYNSWFWKMWYLSILRRKARKHITRSSNCGQPPLSKHFHRYNRFPLEKTKLWRSIRKKLVTMKIELNSKWIGIPLQIWEQENAADFTKYRFNLVQFV